MRRLCCLAAAITLASCAGPAPPTPPAARVTPPTRWRTEAGPVAPIAADWWRAFGDPVLTVLVERALTNNTDIALAAARVREARAQERLARSQLFPSLDLGVGATRARDLTAFGTLSNSTGISPVFQASYEVDLFGRIGDQVKSAREGVLANQAARDATALSVASAVVSGYVTLRALDGRLAVARRTLDSRAEALRVARRRAETGYTSELEMQQAQAEYEATAQIVPQIELQAARQENALSQLLGAAPGPIPRGLSLDELHRPAIPQGLPSDLLRRRPDVAQAEHTLAAADSTLAAARAQFMPQILLTGSTDLVLSSALDSSVTVWSLGASVLAPIFNGGRLRAQANTAAARRDQAAFAYQRTALTAFREAEDNLVAVRKLSEQRTSLEDQHTAVAEALRHATNRYQGGYSSYLEQLDAQRALLNVELSLVQTEADQLNALVALHQAMGGGWTSPP